MGYTDISIPKNARKATAGPTSGMKGKPFDKNKRAGTNKLVGESLPKGTGGARKGGK
ncbi:MAG: hypothetical protein LBL95_01360 [Deltaproteobacteria bacterium]|jgi:hypothetical protein|nr:hypothetical protein [Deltaproteobacteria bacterium]